MGEKYDVLGGAFLITQDGKTIPFTGVTEVKIDEDNYTEEKNEVYAVLNKDCKMEFECSYVMSRYAYFMLVVGPSRRMVRRAIRWCEKLRRKGVPKEDILTQAAYKARFGGNNKKPKKYRICRWGIYINTNDGTFIDGHRTFE